MVHLILSTTKGNSSTRPFPHQGYLGLTPVRVDGIVSVRLDEDRKPINAKSLTVSLRAYEARQGRVGGAPHSRLLVDYTQTLWRKPDGEDYAELAELSRPFKITLPKRVAGFSTVNLLDYRTYWRLEVVLEHESLASVGTRLLKHADILLVRHDTPPPLLSPSATPQTTLPTLSHATNKPRAPVLHYNLSTPTFPIGPSDIVFTSVFIRPVDPTVSIRSASLLVERRIDLHEIEAPTSSSVSSPASPSPFAYHASGTPPPISISSSAPESSENKQHADFLTHGTASRSTMTIDSDSNASSLTITSRTPLFNSPSTDSQANLLDYPPPITPISPSTPSEYTQPRKSVVTTVAAAEGTGFAFDRENSVWSKTISLPWPASRSHWKWGMGESMRGSLGAVSFWVRVKVIVTSSSGTESIELAPSEILVVPTNDAERRQAAARYAEARASSKARSSNSRGGETAESSHGTSTADPERPRSPSEIAYFRYAPPKSAEVSSSAREPISSKKHPLPSTPPEAITPSAQAGSGSSGKTALATFSKVIPSKKKSRRPHTSAGPRDGADVQMGLAIPIPVPVPNSKVPMTSNGYLSSSSSSSSADTPPSFTSGRHKRRSSSGKLFLSRSPERETHSSSSSAPRSPPPSQPSPRSSGGHRVAPNPDENSFRTNFTGLNGINSPSAMALEWNQHQPRQDVEEWERERARERDEQSRELVRAWEEELAQIEKSNKRREGNNMLGFLGALGRRKAKAGAS